MGRGCAATFRVADSRWLAVRAEGICHWRIADSAQQCFCAVQFGKVDANTYIMDFNPTIVSAAQAFAVSLSTFDTKVLL